MRITVLFCIDGNYWQHLGAAISSLFISNPDKIFRIVIASANDMDPEKLKTIGSIVPPNRGSVEGTVFSQAAKYQHFRTHSHLTFATYLRLFMTEYLDPAIDRILYLDGDIIVAGDLAELWETDLGDAYLGAAPEPYDYRHRAQLGFGPDDLYVNAGVMLVDVAKWRANDVLPKLIDFATNTDKQLPSLDQDIINSVLRGHIKNIGYRWNWQALLPRFTPQELKLSPELFKDLRRSPRIVHYTSHYKPWYYRWQPHYKQLYYNALSRTPWANYVPPDRTVRNLPVRIVKGFQQKLEWYLPSLARSLRGFRKAGGEVA